VRARWISGRGQYATVLPVEVRPTVPSANHSRAVVRLLFMLTVYYADVAFTGGVCRCMRSSSDAAHPDQRKPSHRVAASRFCAPSARRAPRHQRCFADVVTLISAPPRAITRRNATHAVARRHNQPVYGVFCAATPRRRDHVTPPPRADAEVLHEGAMRANAASAPKASRHAAMPMLIDVFFFAPAAFADSLLYCFLMF